MRSGAEPSSTTRSLSLARVSSSHRRFTVSDHPVTFCTSSRASTAPAGWPPSPTRARSHCAAIQAASRRAGSSAEAYTTGSSAPSRTCCTSVVLPTWRAPPTTWRGGRGSPRGPAGGAGRGGAVPPVCYFFLVLIFFLPQAGRPPPRAPPPPPPPPPGGGGL